jgi:hypothetical protein
VLTVQATKRGNEQQHGNGVMNKRGAAAGNAADRNDDRRNVSREGWMCRTSRLLQHDRCAHMVPTWMYGASRKMGYRHRRTRTTTEQNANEGLR